MYRTSSPLILILFILITACADHHKNDEGSKIRESFYREFTQAVNSSDSSKIKEQILSHWSDTLIGKNNRWLTTDMNYWMAAHREFGDLKFISFGKDTFNSNQVAWFKGEKTKDWVGLEFDFNEKNKITATNVLRSCIPSYLNKKNKKKDVMVSPEDYSKYFKQLEAEDLFSGKVLIAVGDSIIHQGVYGFADKPRSVKLDEDHKMVIASTTKMFTATAIAQLFEKGLISLEAPISEYLTDFPAEIGEKVTLAHLLTHTSGIELDELDGFMAEISKARNVEEFYQLNLKYLPKIENFEDFTPLEELDYSNENFDILGRIIEVISGKDFYTYLEENIFIPAGMKNTGPVDMNAENDWLAHNYQLNRAVEGEVDNGFRDEVAYSNLSYSRPAGSFYSTPKDLFRFMKALNEGKLISDKTRQEFVSKKVENLNLPIYRSWYGYGFYINERYGHLNYGHAGGIPGVSSRCEYYPEYDTYVIVISNYNGSANLAANFISSTIPYLGK